MRTAPRPQGPEIAKNNVRQWRESSDSTTMMSHVAHFCPTGRYLLLLWTLFTL